MPTRRSPTDPEDLVDAMTREDEELDGEQPSRQHWEKHLDEVTAAVTSAKVRKTYRNNLVRFVLFLHDKTRGRSENDDINDETQDSGATKADYNLLHDRLKADIDAVPNTKISGKDVKEKTGGKIEEGNGSEEGHYQQPH
jgi:hypothetical protein